jgi:protein CpxP
MKKLVLMIAFVVGTTAFAQERKIDKKENLTTQARVEKMTKELDLTPEQQKKLTTIFDNKKVEMQKQKEAAKLERAEKREALTSRNDEMEKEIKSILTPEQAKKWEATKQERMEKRANKLEDSKKATLKKRD